jgi:hypothetical protein
MNPILRILAWLESRGPKLAQLILWRLLRCLRGPWGPWGRVHALHARDPLQIRAAGGVSQHNVPPQHPSAAALPCMCPQISGFRARKSH